MNIYKVPWWEICQAGLSQISKRNTVSNDFEQKKKKKKLSTKNNLNKSHSKSLAIKGFRKKEFHPHLTS